MGETARKPDDSQEILTYEQYQSLPEGLRMEVYDGVPYDMEGNRLSVKELLKMADKQKSWIIHPIVGMASPSIAHQDLSGELFYEIKRYIKEHGGKCKVFSAPCDLTITDNPLSYVQPDLMVVCDKSKLGKNRCEGAPDLVMEIVSQGSRLRDYVEKTKIYMDIGVREYWIVDPGKEKVLVYNFEADDNILEFHTLDETIPVNIFPDLSIDFSALDFR